MKHDCEICRETKRAVNRTARFWEFVNGTWVKLSIPSGVTLRHVRNTSDEEGSGYEANEWENDGQFVRNCFHMEARDCDGRVSQHGQAICHHEKLRARRNAPAYSPDGIGLIGVPEWKKISSNHRDYSAEAAGY